MLQKTTEKTRTEGLTDTLNDVGDKIKTLFNYYLFWAQSDRIESDNIV